ncbi:cysteine synthase A [Humidisolicoccus flavus]|uniref:cysteine synthase A n=1 Tax=Humidisolicoccus flavus TaxID=3111414 RepID=UPI0032443544
MPRIHDDITTTIGRTPLVRINQLNTGGADVLAKLEFFNPGASVKDRLALAVIEAAEASGELKPGGTIVEGTSGNTGIGLAMLGAARGYRVILAMPDTMSFERRSVVAAFGAELVLTPGAEGMKGAVAKAKEIVESTPGAILARQFDNDANPQMHYKTTGPEIWEDTDGKVDIFVAGIGTGGTLSGVGKFLKEKNPEIQIIGVEPIDSPLLTEGTPGPHKIQGIGPNFVPNTLDRSVYDEIIDVTFDDSVATARELTAKEAIFAGISSGAALWAAIEVSKRPENAGKTIVFITCDTGERYLSLPIYKDLAGE